MESLTRHLVVLSTLLLLVIGKVVSQHQEATVYIQNGLPDEAVLTVHCKSKDDDLGEQKIQRGDDWQFSFTPNIFGTTQFFCSFKWSSSSYYYDIYIEKRDLSRCSLCQWNITPNGPCLFNWDTKKYDQCDKWNPKKKLGTVL